MAKGSSDFFAPILEFENTDLDGYSSNFPDGTLCRSENGNNYYCMDGVCEPSSSRRGGRSGGAEDPYNVILTADPDEDDDDDKELNPFFMTNEDGSPKADPPKSSKAEDMPQIDNQDQIAKWKV